MTTRNLFIFITSWLLSTSLLAAELTKQPIVFAYLANGAPVSSMDNDILKGFCGALYEYLRSNANSFDFKPQPLNSVSERFSKFAKSLDGKPGIQCGPDSKTRERANALNDPAGAFTGEFSIPFTKTSTKLLINKAYITKANSLDSIGSAENLRVAVLGAPRYNTEENNASGRCKVVASVEPNTIVTTSLIGQVLHNAQMFECPNRGVALSALCAGDIDAFAGDEIVLNSMYQAWPCEKLTKEKHAIYPPIFMDGFSQEEFVVTFYNLKGSPLIKLVNDWIISPEGKAEAAKLQLPLTDLEQEIKSLHQDGNLNSEQARRDQIKAERKSMQLALIALVIVLLGCFGYLFANRRGLRMSIAGKSADSDLINTSNGPSDDAELENDVELESDADLEGDNCDKSEDNKGKRLLTDEQFDIAVRRTDGRTESQTKADLNVKYKLEHKPSRINNQMRIIRDIYGVTGDENEKLREYLKRDYPEKFSEYEKRKETGNYEA